MTGEALKSSILKRQGKSSRRQGEVQAGAVISGRMELLAGAALKNTGLAGEEVKETVAGAIITPHGQPT